MRNAKHKAEITDTRLYPVTWHNARPRQNVWVWYRGDWRKAVIEKLGTIVVHCRIEGHSTRTRVPYVNAFYRNESRNGSDKPEKR